MADSTYTARLARADALEDLPRLKSHRLKLPNHGGSCGFETDQPIVLEDQPARLVELTVLLTTNPIVRVEKTVLLPVHGRDRLGAGVTPNRYDRGQSEHSSER